MIPDVLDRKGIAIFLKRYGEETVKNDTAGSIQESNGRSLSQISSLPIAEHRVSLSSLKKNTLSSFPNLPAKISFARCANFTIFMPLKKIKRF
jgi:hypothetical protein